MTPGCKGCHRRCPRSIPKITPELRLRARGSTKIKTRTHPSKKKKKMYLGCVHSSAFGGSDQQVSPRPRLALDGQPDSVPDRRTAWLGSEEPQGRAQSPCPAWKGSAKQLWAVQVGILGYWDIGATTPQGSRDPPGVPPSNQEHQCRPFTSQPELQEPERMLKSIGARGPPGAGAAHPPAAGRPRSPPAPAPPPSSAPSAPGRRACPGPAPGSNSGGS